MFDNIDYNNFPFIISSSDGFNYERNSIKNKIIPKIKSLFKNSKHFSLKAFDLVYKAPKKNEIRLKELNDFVLLNMDSIINNGSICICLLGEEYGDISSLISQPDTDFQDALSSNDRLKDSITMTADSGYPWIHEEMKLKDLSFLELLSMQAGLMTKVKFPLFYFRVSGGPITEDDQTKDPWNEDINNTDPRMERLKQKLIRNGLPIRFYGSATEFDDVVEKDIINIISNYPDKSKMKDDFVIDQRCFEKEKCKYFTKNIIIEKIINDFDSFYSSLFNWKKSMSESSHSERIDLALKNFYRKDFSDKLHNSLQKMNQRTSINSSNSYERIRILILSGARGSGKSTILANWLSYQTNNNIIPIIHYCEASSEASDLRAMLRRLIHSIRSKCGYEKIEDSGEIYSLECEIGQLKQELMGALLLSQHVGLKLLIVIDGVDHLGDKFAQSSKQIKDTKWIPEYIPDNVRIVLSCASSDSTFIILRNNREDVKVLEIIPEGDNESESIKFGIAGLNIHITNYSQICPENIIRSIKDWHLISSPLAQRILAHSFHTLGNSSNWSLFIESLGECSSLVELVRRLLKLWVSLLNWEVATVNDKSLKKKISQRKEEKEEDESFVKGWIPDCLSLIVLTRDGLLVDVIPSLLEKLGYVREYFVSESEIWSLFHFARGAMLKYHNGKIEFCNSLCKGIIAHTFLAIANCSSVETRTQESSDSMFTDKRCKLHILLANHFWENQDEHEDNIEECIYHLDRASDYETMENLILNPKVLLRLFNIRLENLEEWLGDLQSTHKYLYYCQILERQGFDLIAKIKTFLTEHYNICTENCNDINLEENFQPRFKIISYSDKKNCFQSEFTRKLRISYDKKKEKEIFLSLSKNQSTRYLFLLGKIASLMKKNVLAKIIYNNVIKNSEDSVLVSQVMFSIIKLRDLHNQDEEHHNFIRSTISELDQLTSNLLEIETDFYRKEYIVYTRCFILIQQCSFELPSLSYTNICIPLHEVRSYTKSLKSILLNCQLLELESDTLEISNDHEIIQRKISLLSKAITTLITLTGPVDSYLARLWIKLASCFKQGNYQSRLKAEACCRIALSIWKDLTKISDNVYNSEEGFCHELLINLLIQDISHTSLSEAKNHLFTTYDSRVKYLGCYHKDTKRLIPLIKLVNSIESKFLNHFNPQMINSNGTSNKKINLNYISFVKNESNKEYNDSKFSNIDGRNLPSTKPNSRCDSRPLTGLSLQFINKFSSNSDSFQEDIDWDGVAEGNNFMGSRNTSSFSKRSISMKTDLLSCGISQSLRVSSTSMGDDVERNIYSGHNASLSCNDLRGRLSQSQDSRRPKQVHFSTSLKNPYLRQNIMNSIQPKLAQMQISKSNTWIPKKKSFSATFSRPYYSRIDPMM